ncbi:transposase [Pontibaca salina]|uniref:Transposase n=1 Tax=Pontibaca salina TaxID=2795731 RepID=A0A934HVW6_9RHOB|nr:transposase [Pontibaca salina]MBI6630489.1 transposase [Pontibaca salina]
MATRNRNSAEFKANVALEAIGAGLMMAELAKKHAIHPMVIDGWKKAAMLPSKAPGLWQVSCDLATAKERVSGEDPVNLVHRLDLGRFHPHGIAQQIFRALAALQKFVLQLLGNRHRPCSAQEARVKTQFHRRSNIRMSCLRVNPQSQHCLSPVKSQRGDQQACGTREITLAQGCRACVQDSAVLDHSLLSGIFSLFAFRVAFAIGAD